MSEFRWNPGSRLTKKILDPQVAGDALETLTAENGGRLTARVVLEAARPIEAPLHPAFEWDDLRAAELYREDQARHVLNAIRIVQPSANPKAAAILIHAYVNLEEQIGDETQRAYVPVMRVFNDADLLKQAIQKAAAELRAFETRYSEFDAIARAARQAVEAIEGAAQAA